jgi:TATA-box binding protein (TBP) (component of TFIID and TFIIIB)
MYESTQRDAVDLAWFQAYQQQAPIEDDVSSGDESWSSFSEEAPRDEAIEEMEVERVERVERVEQARRFCESLMPGLAPTAYERQALHCPTDWQYEAVRRRVCNLYAPEEQQRPQPRPPTRPAVAVPKFKKVYTVAFASSKSSSVSLLNYMVENYVNVADFGDGRGGREERQFNLVALAQSLLGYYVEYSYRKFAKVNLRYLRGCSHLLYGSFLCVETGSDNQETSRALLAHTVRLLRSQCGYPRLRVRQRVCQNIVLTGHVNYPVSLERLQDLFLDAVKPEECPGVIVRLGDLERWFANRGQEAPPVLASDYRDEDADDAAFIQALNAEVEDGSAPQPPTPDEAELQQRLHQTDEYHAAAGGGAAHNGTFLVFSEGQIICTGCKRERQAHLGFTLIFQLLEQCKAQK